MCVISSEETFQQLFGNFSLKMENLSNIDENDDAGYHQSPRSIDPNDQSAAETPVYSTMSIDSFVYPRTCSDTTSGFSDHIDETNSFCSEEASPSNWPVLTESKSDESSKCLSAGLEIQSTQNLAVQEISEPGTVFFVLSLSLFLSFSTFFFFFSEIKMCFRFCAELETMKERFAKLLLGEDMSGSGKGVCTAVTISNAITNLYGKHTKPTVKHTSPDAYNLCFFFFVSKQCLQQQCLDRI